MAPKTIQDRPKTAPRRSLRGFLFASNFVCDFGPFWLPFWCHFGALLEPQIGHFRGQFFIDFCISCQERPKRPSRAPKRRSRAPKRLPRGAKKPPRGSQEAPTEPKRAPRGRQTSMRKNLRCRSVVVFVFVVLVVEK